MRWYMAEYIGMTDNEYGQFASDADAIAGFTSNIPEGEELAEIFRCADDECLTPKDHPIWH